MDSGDAPSPLGWALPLCGDSETLDFRWKAPKILGQRRNSQAMDPVIALVMLLLGVALFAALWTFSSVLTLRRELRQLRAEVQSLGRKRAKHLERRAALPTAVPANESSEPQAPPEEPELDIPLTTQVPPRLAVLGVEAASVDPVQNKSARPNPDPKPAEPPFDWERLLGIRGAAVVGGIALVLAGIFFVQVAIERGWLGPAARDLLAFGIGSACLALHAPLRRRGMTVLADSVAGAGTVLVYGASWAAAQLHGLISTPLAYSVMTATTGLALFVAVRNKAPIVAAFALVGGFATPLLLDVVDSGSLGILVYVLILNGVLLAFGRIHRWDWAWPMAAMGAATVQLAWVWAYKSGPSAWLASIAIGAVVSGFLLSPTPPGTAPRAGADSEPRRFIYGASYVIAIGASLACILRIGLGLNVAGGLWPVGAFAAMLLIASAIADRGIRTSLFLPGSSMATVLLLVITMGESSRHEGSLLAGAIGSTFQDWTWVSASAGALIAALCVALRRGTPALAYGLTGLALLRIATYAGRVEDTIAFTPALAIFAGSALFGSSRVKGSSAWGAAAGLLTGLMLCLQVHGVMGRALTAASPLPWAASGLAVFAAVTGFAIRRDTPLRRALSGFALWAPLPILLLTLEAQANLPALQIAAAAIAAASAAAALAVGPSKTVVQSSFVSAAAAAAMLWAWSMRAEFPSIQSAPWSHGLAAAALVLAPLAVMVRMAPLLRRHGEWLVWSAALPAASVAVGPAAFLVEYSTGTVAGWHGTVAAVAIALLGSAGLVRLRSRSTAPVAARCYPMAMTLGGLAAAAVALSASRGFAAQWQLVATALCSGSIAHFTLRARSPQPGAAASMMTGWGAALLVGLTYVADTFLAEPFYLPIELSIDYGMTATGVLFAYAGSRFLKPASELRVHIAGAALAFILILAFAWTNATVLNRFAQGGYIRIDPERLQQRDLAISMAWTAFAALTLGAGMWRNILALRWTSLGLLVATIFKVFLYDLGALEGLSRVGSFLGLSVALLGVSVAYSRLLKSPEPVSGQG